MTTSPATPLLAVIGGGQLARMMAQSAVGLGRAAPAARRGRGRLRGPGGPRRPRRRLPRPGDAARGRRGLLRRHLRPRARPHRAPPRARRGGTRLPARPGGAGARPGQGGDAGQAGRSSASPRPATALVGRPCRGVRVRRGGRRLPGGAQDHPGRLRRQGRLGGRSPSTTARPPFEVAAPSRCRILAEELVDFRRELSALGRAVARPGRWRPTRWSSRSSATASAGRSSRPRPASTRSSRSQAQQVAMTVAAAARRHRHPRRRAVRDRPTAGSWSTSWRCARTTPVTGASTAP